MGALKGPAPAAAATTLQRQAFTSSGTKVVPAGVTVMRIRTVGGGGSGNQYGGGGGGEVRDRFVAVTPGTTLTVTIGAGGAGSNAGAVGGDTTVTGTGVSETARGGKISLTGPIGAVPGGVLTGALGQVVSTFPNGIRPPGFGGVHIDTAPYDNQSIGGGEVEPGFGAGGGGGNASSSGAASPPASSDTGGVGSHYNGVNMQGGTNGAANSGSGGGGGYTSTGGVGVNGNMNGGSGYAELEWVA